MLVLFLLGLVLCPAYSLSLNLGPGPTAIGRQSFICTTCGALLSQSFSSGALADPEETFLPVPVDRARWVDEDYGFALLYPKKWTVSPRRGKTPLQQGARSSTGTVLAIGQYVEGLSASVSVSNIRTLLEDAGFDSAGRMEVMSNIGKPMGVADLLLRQRDGKVEEKSPLSRVQEASANGNELDFTVQTIVRLTLTGNAPSQKPGEVPDDPLIRKTIAKAFLRRNGEIVTVWASALESQWPQYGALLEDIVRDFRIDIA